MTTKTKVTKKSVAEKATNVVKKATEAVKRPTVKSLKEELEAVASIAKYNFDVAAQSAKENAELREQVSSLRSTIIDMTNMLDEKENQSLASIAYERFVRWLCKVTGYFKE